MIEKRTRYTDAEGNVYGVEKSARNGKFVVIRTNPGDNRKAVKHLPTGNAGFVQGELDGHAKANGWTEVAE